MVEYHSYLKRFKALADKDACANAINHRRNRRMSSALQQINGNRSFRGIIQTKGNGHALNARLSDQAGNVGFLHGESLSDFFFPNRWKRLPGLVIEYQPGTNTVNGWGNAWNGVAGDMDQQSAFTCIVRTGARR